MLGRSIDIGRAYGCWDRTLSLIGLEEMGDIIDGGEGHVVGGLSHLR